MIRVPLTLIRLTIILGFAALAIACVGVAGLLAFAGYMVYLVGSSKAALACWAAACGSLVFLGIAGTFLPSWLRPPRWRRHA